MRFYALALLWFALLTGGLPEGVCEDAHAVLVTSADNKLAPLTQKQLRALYVGFPVAHNSHLILPIINASDTRLYQAFLQKVMFMSDKNYRRQVTARVFRKGGEGIHRSAEPRELITTLHAIPLSVTFIEAQSAAAIDGIRILQILW